MPDSNPNPVRDRLVADHERLERTFERLIAAFEADDRGGVAESWTEFERELSSHLQAEETWLVPALLRSHPRAARAILEEHGHIRRRLLELGASVDLYAIRLETARAFVDELRAHARHEDRALYQWADADLDESVRKALLAALVPS